MNIENSLYNILYRKESIPIRNLRYFPIISTLDQIPLSKSCCAKENFDVNNVSSSTQR